MREHLAKSLGYLLMAKEFAISISSNAEKNPERSMKNNLIDLTHIIHFGNAIEFASRELLKAYLLCTIFLNLFAMSDRLIRPWWHSTATLVYDVRASRNMLLFTFACHARAVASTFCHSHSARNFLCEHSVNTYCIRCDKRKNVSEASKLNGVKFANASAQFETNERNKRQRECLID